MIGLLNAVLPTEGFVIRGGQEFAGLGGDIRYVQSTAGWSWFATITSRAPRFPRSASAWTPASLPPRCAGCRCRSPA